MENEYQSRSTKIINIIKANKWALIFIICAVLIGILIFILFPKKSDKGTPINQQKSKITPGMNQPSMQSQNGDFTITSTTPKNDEQNVYSGEISIIFTTDTPILSDKDFHMTIYPPLPNYWKFTNTYPTNKITAQVYGGLQTNTTYTVTVTNKKNGNPYSWVFRTSGKQQEDSTQIIRDQTENENAKYFPLFDYIPYESNDFSIDYTDKLTLVVKIKNPDVEMVKKEVNDWIRSHNVNPSTHTITFENAF